MHEILERALRFAGSCEQVEIYGEHAEGLSIDFERWSVKQVKRFRSRGVGIRAVVANKVGFSYTTDLSDDALRRCVEEAVRRAKASEADSAFCGLPAVSPERYRTAGAYDKRIVELCNSPEDALDIASELLEGVQACEDESGSGGGGVSCEPTEGGFSVAYDHIFILNSEGVSAEDSGTFASAGITVVARSKTAEGGSAEEIAGSEGEAKRRLSDLNLRWISEEATLLALRSLGGQKAETKEMPVVLSPRAVQSILAYTTVRHFSAENVQRNRSPYKGRLGEEIASEMLTIVDDGTAEGRLNTRKMDGEGVPSQRTVLIERGVLKNFLYDTYTASKDGVESTGNAVRGYDQPPSVGATNFIIERGDATREEILRELNEGILVSDVIGAHTADATSGAFSVVAQNAFSVKRGELKPLREVMLVGNSVEMLKRVEIVAKDSRQIYNIASPTILVAKMQIVS
ncbi:MAG: TldD/PmbA family protein [Methanophagales archaeon]|nr:TldD/PmbA family protein [Methanophagales archaeon]